MRKKDNKRNGKKKRVKKNKWVPRSGKKRD